MENAQPNCFLGVPRVSGDQFLALVPLPLQATRGSQYATAVYRAGVPSVEVAMEMEMEEMRRSTVMVWARNGERGRSRWGMRELVSWVEQAAAAATQVFG